jgi:glycosyltransferase involved in cell wall biosynthesis
VELVETRFHSNERIKLLTGSKRLGKGGSINDAIQSVSKQYLAYVDVDLSADP